MAKPVEDISHCGCAMPAGMWGSCGWHFVRADRPRLMRMEMQGFADRRAGMTRVQMRFEWDSWWQQERDQGRVDEYGMHEMWKPSIGLPVAVQPCPAYRAAIRSDLEREKMKLAGEKRGKRVLGDE